MSGSGREFDLKAFAVWLAVAMRKGQLRRFLLFSMAHAILTMSLVLFAFSSAMGSFDTDLPESLAARAAGKVAGVLVQPGAVLWTRRLNETANWMEWPLFLANSALWGLAAAMLSGWIRRARRT